MFSSVSWAFLGLLIGAKAKDARKHVAAKSAAEFKSASAFVEVKLGFNETRNKPGSLGGKRI